MAPKHNSDATGLEVLDEEAPAHKKACESDASVMASSSTSQDAENMTKPKSWQDIMLEGEDDGGVSVYRVAPQVPPSQLRSVTHWLKEIGGINNNSYGCFMKDKGKTNGASNGTYCTAVHPNSIILADNGRGYVYLENP